MVLKHNNNNLLQSQSTVCRFHFTVVMFKINDLYGAISPILTLTAIMGISTIQIIKTKNNDWENNKQQQLLEISTKLKLLTFIYLTIFTYVIYLSIIVYKNDKIISLNNYSLIGVSSIGLIFQLIVQILCAYLIYLSAFHNEKIQTTIERIVQIDRILIDDLLNNNNYLYWQHFRYEIIVIIIGLFTISSSTILHYIAMKLNEQNRLFVRIEYDFYIVLMWPNYLVYTIQTQFTLLVRLLYERFTLINNQLIKSIHNNNNRLSNKSMVNRQNQNNRITAASGK